MKLKAAIAVASLLFLSACATTGSKPSNGIAPRPPVAAPTADPLNLKEVQWKVYNTAELKALADQLKGTDNVVLFTLDEGNFKSLNDNLSDIKSYIKQQNVIIVFLKKSANVDAAKAGK